MPSQPERPDQSSMVMRNMIDRMLSEMAPSNPTRLARATNDAQAVEGPSPCERDHAPAPGQEPQPGSAELPPALCRAYGEISAMLRILRSSRDTLEQTTTEKLHLTSAKLEEVTSATEVAATSLLDGLDRALGLVDELDGLDTSANERAMDTRSRLREELFQSINYLQFQDITSQQLNYASSVLLDIEHRLGEIVESFDPSSIAVPCLTSRTEAQPAESAGLITFDPDASLQNAERRQAIADEILTRMG